MQMVIVSLCSIALVISILKPRKRAAKAALRAAGAVVVGVAAVREASQHHHDYERQPLYASGSSSEPRVDELDERKLVASPEVRHATLEEIV